jgi:hypothetical protein
MGWRLGRQVGRRGFGVLNPLPQTPRTVALKLVVSGGIAGVVRKAD